MHKHLLRLCLAATLLAGAGIDTQAASTTPGGNEPRPGIVRVKLQPEVSKRIGRRAVRARQGERLTTGVATLDTSLEQIGGVTLTPLFPCAPSREAEHAKYGLDRWYEVSFDETVNPLEARRILSASSGVENATAKKSPVLFDEPASYTVVKGKPTVKASSAAMPFNDPRLPDQWHYYNDGSLNGSLKGADINLFDAWKISTGSPDIIVAIVDGGVDYTHEDLAANMLINYAELNGKPGVDDDGDGYIDNIYGYNFCTNTGEIYPHSHGTHVAGTVAAVNGNGIGVCGVAGGNGTPGSGVKLMSCQAFDSRSGSGEGDFAAALIYAADHGATIAQCSWGWSEEGYYEQDVLDAVKYFTNTARSNNMTGGLCIFSSGNEGTEAQVYPGCMPEVVAVAAMCFDGTIASYSNYGDWVDISAPGGNLDFNEAEGVLSTLPGDSYGYNNGTSMSAPHVSGIAALVLAAHGSQTMINENLRRQLITSVNDLYGINPKYEGKAGSGYIDAHKALQWGDGSAPEAVADFTLLPSQDNVVVAWNVPAASDNNVNSHIIYYSDKAFTESSLDGCKTAIVDTKFYVSGDPVTHEISDLSAMTTYWFAIQAVDRWNNASPLSPVKQATTNAGPRMTLDKSAVVVQTTDGGTTWRNSEFNISNVDEGLLRWSASTRTILSSIASYAPARREPAAIKPFSGHVAVQLAEAKPETVIDDLQDFTTEDFPQKIANADYLHAFIGDEDSDNNSMAQLFYVDPTLFPDGFNLTHYTLWGAYGQNPTVEIYRNVGTIANAQLLYRYEPANFAYYFDQQLPEQFYFAPGESFYIAVHFSETVTRPYPLGLAKSNGTYSTATQAYMSTDLGKTWSLLSEVLKGTAYDEISSSATWAIVCHSKNPDWSRIIELTPATGELRSGDTQAVAVSTNATKVPNGTYRAVIDFTTNETDPEAHKVAVAVNVSGHAPEVVFNKVVQFGNLLVGQSKTVNIAITNTGYGAFTGSATSPGIYSSNITSTHPAFSGPNTINGGFPARSTVEIPVTYTPTEPGSHAGVIVIKDRDGRELRINVQGAATAPAKLAVEPEGDIMVGDLEDGAEPTDVQFKISNAGAYPLQFTMPKFTDMTYDDIVAGSVHRFGYNWQSNLNGSTAVEYTGAPELVGAVDLVGQVGDYDYFTDAIDLGFEFPFYGKIYEKCYISKFGSITFDTYDEGTIYSPLSETRADYMGGLGVISAYGFEFETTPTSHIWAARQDGKFVVYFENVLGLIYATDMRPISFSIALSSNGDIDVAFHDYTAADLFQDGSTLWVGIADPDMEDPLTVTSANVANYFGDDDLGSSSKLYTLVNSGTAFRFLAPRPDMIASISPTNAILAPGESVDINVKVQATEEMFAGDTYTDLVINSNDIVDPTKLVRFRANVTGDLKPVFDLATESVDFGRVFRTSLSQASVTVQNHGRAPLAITAVNMAEGKFSHDFTGTPVTVDAGRSKDILVTLPTETEGAVADVMTITTDAGEKTVCLSGEVGGVPQATLSYTRINATLASGSTRDYPLTVTNDGNEPLTYSVLAGNHFSFAPEFEEGSKTDYSYVASFDDPSATRDWTDIETNGLGEQHGYTYYLKHDWIEVELPFEFPYMGQRFDKFYLYNTGFVSFTPHSDDKVWPEPPSTFPSGSTYVNVIAPYWGLHTMDVNRTAGTYHYVTDDQAVISWIEYGNSMNIGVCFQLVLRKDGSFTFLYKPAFDYAMIWATFGVAGYSDANGEGLRLPDRYIDLGDVVHFTPVVESTLQPGESRVAALSVVGDQLAGTYTSQVTINTNVPSEPKITIPANIRITGKADPSLPADVEMEFVAGTQNQDVDDQLIGSFGIYQYAPLSIGNTGTAAFTVTGVDIDSPTDAEGQPMFQLLWYGTTEDVETGSTVSAWTLYDGSSFTVGRGSTRFAVPMWNYDSSATAWQTPGEYNVRLTFYISGVSGVTEHVANVKFIVTEAPVMSLDRNEVSVAGLTDADVRDEVVVISNADGKYPLKWNAYVDITGVGEEFHAPLTAPRKIEAAGSEASEAPADATLPGALFEKALKPLDAGHSDNYYNAPTDFEYRRALYWPAQEGTTAVYNWGSMNTYSEFIAATAFTAPDDGFNISHVYTGMLPSGMANSDIVVRIYQGNPQETDVVLSQGRFTVAELAEDEDPRSSRLIVVPMDRSVYMGPGQEFYIAVTYPVGQEYPSLVIAKEDKVTPQRYLAWSPTTQWYDMAENFSDSYGSLGYLMTAIETVEGDAWCKVLDADGNVTSAVSGEIAPGSSAQLKLRLKAIDAPKEVDNEAIVVLKSNDPKAMVTNLPVSLSKNSTPVVKFSSETMLVQEGSTAVFTATVSDADGDDLTVELRDNGSAARISGLTGCEGTVAEDGMSAIVKGGSGTVEITLAAEYETEGTYAIGISATDTEKQEGFAVSFYTVEHANRAPELLPLSDMVVTLGQMSEPLDISTLFRDPDGDVLEYGVGVRRTAIATLYTSGNKVVFSGNKKGTTGVVVMATDPSGASVTGEFTLTVADASGINDIDADIDWTLYPNPVKDILNVKLAKAAEASFEVYNMGGARVADETFSGSTHSIDLTSLPSGLYIARVTTAEGSASQVIVKE